MITDPNAADAPGLRVLLIDDNPDHVLLIRRAIMATAPHTVVESASDANEASHKLRAGVPHADIILLDINMPGQSGLELLAQLKVNDELRSIPVVMLTSSELPRDIERAYELGASGYISKPSKQTELRAVLGNTLLYWSVMRRVTGGDMRA